MQEAYRQDVSTSHASKATPQYGFNRGIKEFGEEGWAATKSEIYENLIGMDAVSIIEPDKLDKTLAKNALPYLMFLKRKRLGKVKSRGCADGRPQHEFISKEETRSPTVSTYALMASCCMDAIEGRTVYTCDIQGAFLQSIWPKKSIQHT